MEAPLVFADLNLARRLERAAALSRVELMTARAKAFPESGVGWLEVAGAYALFDGTTSPLTQAFGLGLFGPVSPEHLEQVEYFFQERGAPVCLEISPLADPSLWPLLNERGYQPLEFTNVLFCSLPLRPTESGHPEQIQARLVDDPEQDLWTRTLARSEREPADVADFMLGLPENSPSPTGSRTFLDDTKDHAMAAGGLSLHEGVALLADAPAMPGGWQQDAQAAWLRSRLHFAAEHGCDLAMLDAPPGSAAQCSAERLSFRIAYTRIKWQLSQAADYKIYASLSGEMPAGRDPESYPG